MEGSSEHHKSIAALNDCDTLMLDMDGTLLDLAYDNYMWFEHIPAEYARQNSINEADARELLAAKFRNEEGKLQWYCLDYWSEVLDLDVKELHRRENERIGYLPGAKDFLESVLQHEVRLLLVTNSHLDTLAIKTEVTGITDFLMPFTPRTNLGTPKKTSHSGMRCTKRRDSTGKQRFSSMTIRWCLRVPGPSASACC